MGLYHLAWEIETLDDLEGLASELSVRGALVGASDHCSTKALYARDPDDLEFEVSWLVRAAPLDDQAVAAKSSIRPAWADASCRVSAPAPGALTRHGRQLVGGMRG